MQSQTQILKDLTLAIKLTNERVDRAFDLLKLHTNEINNLLEGQKLISTLLNDILQEIKEVSP